VSREARPLSSVQYFLAQLPGAVRSLGMALGCLGKSPDRWLLGHSTCSECDEPLLRHPLTHCSGSGQGPARLPGLGSCPGHGEQHEDRLCCETKEHTGTLRVLLVSLFGLKCKKRNMLGSKCCFAPTAQCRWPRGGLTPCSIWFFKALSVVPYPHSTAHRWRAARGHVPAERSSPQSSHVTRLLWWCLQQRQLS